MKSVSHLITTIERGGAENQLLVLVQEQISSGWKVEVIPLKGSLDLREELTLIGAQLNLSLHNKPFLEQLIILKTGLARSIPFLHAHLPRAELTAAFVRKRNTFIFTRHNAEAFMPTRPGIVSIALSRIVTWRACTGIAISHAVKDFLIQTREVSKNYDLRVIHYGYYVRNKVNSKSNSLTNYQKSLSSHVFKVGMIGRLVPQKDYPTLLKAFTKFSIHAPASTLQILGSGYLESELKKLSIELGIDKRVDWVGKTPNVFHYLENFDLFVLTSSYEGFGLVLLEAMDAGVPILASRNSAIPEVMGEHFPGLFETSNVDELANKMLEVFSEAETHDKNLEIFAERLNTFGASNMWKAVENAYTRIRA